ncbi:ABC transporter ATP-binding protein [Methanofollis fontis]|uniref:Lipoprotein-releasing system ATP-binding protein LolD n=1 Tax=Methanofollis fontis TaxID=2052832 RepID=A0A483CRQ5_9EURY|nr:ABC transporter ATP-binding protein [Methanofollis fontis]TAJ45813.1 lipoprotein-releasing system ATP-binding protein LolD [Methanofollis fontis]
MNEQEPIIRFVGVSKVYPLPAGDVVALDNVSLDVEAGEFLAIMGPSGSGKSTLLNLMGCLDTPTAGKLYIKGKDIGSLSDDELTALRRDHIGFIFQQFNLIPLLNVVENVEFPRLLKERRGGCTERCLEILSSVGLERELLTHTPAELSGGQQQRVAIARALINDPEILLADEPTGNLDTKTGTGIMDLLSSMNREGKTIIMVTHDQHVADYARRRIEIVDGRII